jgi:hypothetical protein
MDGLPHPHGLRSTDNRICLTIAFPGGPSATTWTAQIPLDCKCRGCRSYRRWLRCKEDES